MKKILSILLVEDDLLDQKQVERALDRKSILYKLQTVRNGEDALALIKASITDNAFPDLILIDLNMPRMNGIELLTQIRKLDLPMRTKVFVLTNSDRERKLAAELGASGYITKPLRLNNPSLDAINLLIDIMNLQSGDN